MERLTEWRGEHAAIVNHHENYIDRLAAYEDTGLEPEECAEYAQAEKEGRYILLKEPRSAGVHRLEEIARADIEGRLAVLPCKVGDVVYELDRRIMQVYRIIPPSAAFIMSEIENGIEFYKTREEAGKALEGVSDDA